MWFSAVSYTNLFCTVTINSVWLLYICMQLAIVTGHRGVAVYLWLVRQLSKKGKLENIRGTITSIASLI